MKVLVIGGGGREHALVWALRRSPRVKEVVCAPGNGGIADLARCVHVDAGDLAALTWLVEQERPALTVVGPELPLSLGLVDALQRRGFRVFGPTQQAAQLETSKAFAKAFMVRHHIPTARYAVCTSSQAVANEVPNFQMPIVVKADGLAAGKGVVICATAAEAQQAATEMFSGNLLGVAERQIVLEEFLRGEELSFFAVCDGWTAVPLGAAQDHKRIGEGDTGPNTGGMGAYSTDGLMSPELREWLQVHVAQRVVDGMREEGHPFQGVLFCGVMLTPQSDGSTRPMVLEFNTRFGDPETQALMLRLETDVMDLFDAAVDGWAERLTVRMRPGVSVCVIAASAGYPGKYGSGKEIHGLSAAATGVDRIEDIRDMEGLERVEVFHSGTARREGTLVTAGGRVLGVTAASALGLDEALRQAYAAMAGICFEGMQFRRDIGWRATKDASGETPVDRR